MRSDVNVGTALSGGLDSSSVYSAIHYLAGSQRDIYRLPKNWQKAFVAVFPDTEQDEGAFAEVVLNRAGGQGIFMDITIEDNLSYRIHESIKKYDIIYSTPLIILDSVYGAMRKNGITVSMDGHGADEMMYGYPYNVIQAYQFARKNKNIDYAIDLLDTYLAMLRPEQRKNQEKLLKNDGFDFMYRQWNKLKSWPKKHDLEVPWFEKNPAFNMQDQSNLTPTHLDMAEANLYKTFHFTTLPTILRNLYLGAMHNSVEIRMPFLDYRVVTYLFSLPMQIKIGGGFTKSILREAMKGIVPETIRRRKLKTGFNAPLQSWFRKELKELLLDTVHEKSFKESPYFNGPAIQKFVEKRVAADKWTEGDAFRLWPILNAHLLLH